MGSWVLETLTTGQTPYLLVLAVVTVAYFLYTRLRDDETWEKYGVKQVDMGFVDFRTGSTRLMEQYGDTVGIKMSNLQLLTRDLEILKIVMVKDFNNFVDRNLTLNTGSLVAKGVFFQTGDDWRRIRHVLSPSFSSGKLKNISKTIDETAVKLSDVLESMAKKGKMVVIKDTTGQYTSEIIAKTAFGLNSSCLGGEDDEFAFHCKRLFKSRGKVMGKIMLFFFRFRWLHSFLVQKLQVTLLDGVSTDADRYLNSILRRALTERVQLEKSSSNKPRDLLQSLVSAMTAGDKETARITSDVPRTESFDKLPKTMTQDELIGQSMLIIFAGFETTATTLQMCLYLLAKHPDVQDKVFGEIRDVVSGESPTIEELAQLTYLEQVINETLRLFPPAPIMSRKAAETRTYGSITIPKGAGVMIPIFLVLKDPKHFPDPEKFDPDRFSEANKAKRDQMAFMPFGYGPRLCLGMRLAYLELKIGLVHVLRRVTFELNNETYPKLGEEPKLKMGGLLAFEESIKLAVKPRQ